MFRKIKLLLAVGCLGLVAVGVSARTAHELFESQFHFDAECLESLKDSQKPKVLVVGCSDSRVDPALLMGALPGEIFVARNIANLIPAYDAAGDLNTSMGAVLEYAVNALKVSDIVILGHSNCGGIKALMSRHYHKENPKPNGEFIDSWLDIASDLEDRILHEADKFSSKAEMLCCAEKESVQDSAKRLLAYPFVKKAVEEGRLKIHQWYFDIEHKKIVEIAPAI